MLAELHLKNFVLIEQARLEFDPGFNALTGETGAGKSLLLDALGLLFGARVDTSLVRPGSDRAEVTARFLLSDRALVESLEAATGVLFEEAEVECAPASGRSVRRKLFELVISRVVPKAGRSHSHANGHPVSSAGMKRLGEHLLDIHGQHENQSLLRPLMRLEVLDHYAGALAEREKVREAYDQVRVAAQALAELRRASREHKDRDELLRFQLSELEEVPLDAWNSEAVGNELKFLRSAEQIRVSAAAAADALDGDPQVTAAALMARSLKEIEQLGDVGGEAEVLGSRLDDLLTETRDLARDLFQWAEGAQGDPQRLSELEEAQARIRTLERKHARDATDLRELRDALRGQLSALENLDQQFEEREQALKKAVDRLRVEAGQLTKRRKAAAHDLERSASRELKDLGLKESSFLVQLVPYMGRLTEGDNDEVARMMPESCRASGAEGVEFLFTANPDLPPRPLSDCASGGELSRVMLALKGVLAKAGGADRLPVVVFDEVDTGVGGRMGSVLGQKLAALSDIRQVLCVTHLPQVAVYASRQLKVEKERRGAATIVKVFDLKGDDRVEELAGMLRGEHVTKRTLEEAREMLHAAQSSVTSNKGTQSKAGSVRKRSARESK